MSGERSDPRVDQAASVDIFELALKMGQDPLPRRQHVLCRMRDHSERTPSLLIYPDNNSFFCWGCKAGGSPIDYVMGCEGISFLEALRRIETLFELTSLRGAGGSKIISKLESMFEDMRGKYIVQESYDCNSYADLVEAKLRYLYDDLEAAGKLSGELLEAYKEQDLAWEDLDKAVTYGSKKSELDSVLFHYSQRAEHLLARFNASAAPTL